MKKILIILGLVLSLCAYGQRGTGTITVTAGLDTTIWLQANNATLLTVDLTGLDAATDSLWLGYSNDTKSFVATSDFPKVLDKSNFQQYINGTWRNTIGLSSTGKWPGLYAVIRYKNVGTTAGTIIQYTLR